MKHDVSTLVKNIRILDFQRESFSEPLAILIENGMIARIGAIEPVGNRTF